MGDPGEGSVGSPNRLTGVVMVHEESEANTCLDGLLATPVRIVPFP